MNKAVWSLTLAVALICAGFNAAFAADNAKPGAPARAALPKPAMHAPMKDVKEIDVTFTGTNEPHKMKVSGKDVTENELKITSAKDSSGKALPEWSGKTIRYANSGKGKELLEGHANEQLSIRGMFNPQTHILTVTSYEKVEAQAPAK